MIADHLIKSDRLRFFILIAAAIIIGIVILRSFAIESEISENYAVTFGKLIQKTKDFSNKTCTTNYVYEFYHQEKKYRGEDCGRDYFFVSDTLFVKVEYSTKDPTINQLSFSDLYRRVSTKNGDQTDTIYKPTFPNQ